jgi:hypothetical protein
MNDMKLTVQIHSDEVESAARLLIAEINAQHDDHPINKAYFVDRIQEDIEKAMQYAFDEGRIFERTQTKQSGPL